MSRYASCLKRRQRNAVELEALANDEAMCDMRLNVM